MKERKDKFETGIIETIKSKENEILAVYKSNPAGALKMMADLTNYFAEKVNYETKNMLKK